MILINGEPTLTSYFLACLQILRKHYGRYNEIYLKPFEIGLLICCISLNWATSTLTVLTHLFESAGNCSRFGYVSEQSK
jgi:hypothetical protein